MRTPAAARCWSEAAANKLTSNASKDSASTLSPIAKKAIGRHFVIGWQPAAQRSHVAAGGGGGRVSEDFPIQSRVAVLQSTKKVQLHSHWHLLRRSRSGAGPQTARHRLFLIFLHVGCHIAARCAPRGYPSPGLAEPVLSHSCSLSSGRKKYSQEKQLPPRPSQVWLPLPPSLVINAFVIGRVHSAFAEEADTEPPPPPTDAELDAAWGDGKQRI
jgi:hypothetical protein